MSCLRIQDLAIIDELELELGPGLNVVTGETGAGKSILVSALELILGGKGRPELVRSGAKSAEVEALFVLEDDPRLSQALRKLELEAEGELVVRRVLSPCGRARGFVNGRLVPQPVLAELTRGLTDISSQHEHHTLSDPSTHLGYLDAFARSAALRERLSRAYAALRQAALRVREWDTRWRDRAAREELLWAQVQEIEAAALDADAAWEEQELEQRCRRLRSAEALLRLTGEAADLLYERDDSVVDGLAQAGRHIVEAAELDVALAPLAAQLEALRVQLGDAARELGRHVRNTRPDPEALQQAEERLYQLAKLKRRYGGNLEGVLAHLSESRAELEALSQHGTASATLELELARSFDEAQSLARMLSAERRQAAGQLGCAISKQLESLGMSGARIQVALRSHALSPLASPAVSPDMSPTASPAASHDVSAAVSQRLARQAACAPAGFAVDGVQLSAEGLERAEFLIAPNRGEEARSLHRVASGGELGRTMLAIKCVLADLGPAGMYVFDEIDTGVGGGMAEIIGRKIRGVAHYRQVLCITHLPQIAVFAAQHFKMEKLVRAERTLSTVRRLTGKEQREEIARMLGGLTITAKTRAAARELLHQARQVA